MTVVAKAHAKINWALRITRRRADGFHDLETLFQSISLHDTLTFRPAREFTLTCSDPSIPVDDSNLVARAARALNAPPVEIHIEKRIPAGGGLGGGSSDAATTLVTLDQMFKLQTPHERLAELALALGSDVPYFLTGGTAYATGRGEVLLPLPPPPPIPLLLLLPEEKVLTRDAFAMLRGYSPPLGFERCREIVEDDLLFYGNELVNDFEDVVFEVHPHLFELKLRMLAAGAPWAGMSGSGSTIVGAFRSVSTRDAAISLFSDVRAVPCTT